MSDEHCLTSVYHWMWAVLECDPAGFPEHVWLHDIGRIQYRSATDAEAIKALLNAVPVKFVT